MGTTPSEYGEVRLTMTGPEAIAEAVASDFPVDSPPKPGAENWTMEFVGPDGNLYILAVSRLEDKRNSQEE